MTNHHKTIWVSDIHLGTRGCQAEVLLDFLKHNTADTLYLVGDIIDMWALSRRIYFPKSHIAVMKKILKLAKPTRVIYIRGNHDETLDHFVPFEVGNIQVMEECVHTLQDGRQFLVCHGDRYDQVTRYARWLAILGDIGYTMLLRSNGWINWFRKKFGYGHWSLSRYAKNKVKSIVSFIGDFEHAVARDVKSRGYDGVVCGHIHHAEIKNIDGIVYANDGDWVESCSALVEDIDGNLKIVYWYIDENTNSK
jgi:UDP-2,3-diacylglucosamine pyrophosphatase LpxH